LEKKMPPEVCTDCTKITKDSPLTAITLGNGKIEEYIVKTLLSLCFVCNNETETQNPTSNPTEISGEPSKILVNSEQNLTPNSEVDQEKASKDPNPANPSFQENGNNATILSPTG
jgi:hypothetical protein